MRLSAKNSGDPLKKILTDFGTVDLVEHLGSPTRVEIVRDITDTRCAIALYKDRHTFEPLAHGIFASRKHVNGQVMTDLAKTHWVGQL